MSKNTSRQSCEGSSGSGRAAGLVLQLRQFVFVHGVWIVEQALLLQHAPGADLIGAEAQALIHLGRRFAIEDDRPVRRLGITSAALAGRGDGLRLGIGSKDRSGGARPSEPRPPAQNSVSKSNRRHTLPWPS